MGCRGFARDGKGATEIARRSLGFASGRICSRISARRDLLLRRFSALGLASDVFHWRIAGSIGDLRSFTSQGIGGLGKDTSRNLEPTGPGNCLTLAVVYLSRITDDDDELRFARHSGHVSDSVETSLAFQSSEGCGDHGLHDGWGNCRGIVIWPLVGSLWPPALDDRSAVMRNSGNSAVGSFARAGAFVDWRLPDAVYGSRGMGSNPRTPV